MPSDADYAVMALARNPEQFTESERKALREIIDREIAMEYAENKKIHLTKSNHEIKIQKTNAA